MKYHIIWNGRKVASFELKAHRDGLLAYWRERFVYAADQITAKDD